MEPIQVTNNLPFAQGDVSFFPISALPEGLALVEGEERNIVAHSETSHHHLLDGEGFDIYSAANDPTALFAVVKETTNLVHLRGFDTHKPIAVPPGIYRVQRGLEYTPEGYKVSID